MEYKIKRSAGSEIILEKHTESKGFFHNVGLSKVGEIKLNNLTSEGWFEDFLTEENGVFYMMLVGTSKCSFITSYRGEAPLMSIGDKINNIPVEERIKFLYETLNSNANYNCLGIIYKDPDSKRYIESLFKIEDTHLNSYTKEQDWLNDDNNVNDSIVSFSIDDIIFEWEDAMLYSCACMGKVEKI